MPRDCPVVRGGKGGRGVWISSDRLAGESLERLKVESDERRMEAEEWGWIRGNLPGTTCLSLGRCFKGGVGGQVSARVR